MKIDEIYKQLNESGEYDALIIAGLRKNEDEAPVGINGMAADLVGLAGIIVCAIQSEMGVPMDMDNMAKMVSKFRADLLADVKRRMKNE